MTHYYYGPVENILLKTKHCKLLMEFNGVVREWCFNMRSLSDFVTLEKRKVEMHLFRRHLKYMLYFELLKDYYSTIDSRLWEQNVYQRLA